MDGPLCAIRLIIAVANGRFIKSITVAVEIEQV